MFRIIIDLRSFTEKVTKKVTMSTSLIGKALAFDSSEYRFDPCVLKIFIHKPSYVQNHIHFALAQKNPYSKIIYTKKIFTIVKMLSEIGCINKFLLISSNTNNPNKYNILLTILFYNNIPFFSSFRLLSTPTKKFTITHTALKTLSPSLGLSTIILSTSAGLITHKQALKKSIGGLLLFIVS